MSGEPHEVVLDDGVLSFDGRVIEAFGFGRETERVHVAQLEELSCEPGGKRYTVSVIARGASWVITPKVDASRAAEVEAWASAVREAAQEAGA